jgi:hypothetical protein
MCRHDTREKGRQATFPLSKPPDSLSFACHGRGDAATLAGARNGSFRFQSPRIGCLRLSRTLWYRLRRELELATESRSVADVLVRQRCLNDCRNRQAPISDSTRVVDCEVADVAELADALDSKSGTRKGVWVRPPPSAPSNGQLLFAVLQALGNPWVSLIDSKLGYANRPQGRYGNISLGVKNGIMHPAGTPIRLGVTPEPPLPGS